MKRNLNDFLRLVQSPLIIAAGLMPVPILMFTYLQPQLQRYAWIFSVSYFVLTVFCILIPGKLRLPVGLLAVAGMLLPWCLLYSGETLGVCLTVAIGYGLLLLWSIRMGGWDTERELHSAWIGLCLVVQFLGLGVQMLDRQTVGRLLAPVAPWFYLSFFVTVVLCMLAMNRKALNTITAERTAVVRAMHRKNVVLVFLLVGAAAAISLLPSAMGVIKAVIAWIRRLLEALERDTVEETIPTPSTVGDLDNGDNILLGGLQEGKHTELLNKLFLIFFAILVAIGIPFLVYFLGKRLWQAWKRFWKSIRAFTADSMTDYEDEITDTRDSVIADETESTIVRRRRRVFSDRDFSNTEKIRYRYQQLKKKNPQWKEASTARETLQTTSAEIYERARYSTHPITSEDVERFKTDTKNL